MPFQIQGGNDLGTILAGLRPMRDPTEVQEGLVRLRQTQQQAQQQQALFPLQKQEAELALKQAQFNEQERQYGLKERDIFQKTMADELANAAPDETFDKIYARARPKLLAAGLRPTTLATTDKLGLEYGDKIADMAKKQAEAQQSQANTAKIMQGLGDEQREIFGGVGVHMRDVAKYDPTAFESFLSNLERTYSTNKAIVQRINEFRTEAAKGPDALKGVIDAMVTPKAEAAAQELAQKKAQIAKEEAETKLTTAKVPGEEAESAKKQAEMKALTSMKDSDWQTYIDRVIEDHATPLYRRTQQMVQFYRNQGNLKAADDAVKNAGEQLGKTEAAVATAKATVPFKVEVAGAGAAARAEAIADASGLTQDDYNRAGEQYMRTGVMPAVGRDSVTRGKIVKAGNQWARDNGFSPQDVVTMQAAYAGDKESLKKFQAQRDQIVSFEQTAQKNLDLFLGLAQKIVDSGVPWINKPLRTIGAGLGSSDLAAVNAARQIANNEIAKVTSGGGLGGVLSDSARHEVQSFNPNEATFKQTVAVANVLKQDMANRHQSMDATLSDIKSRIGGGGRTAEQTGGGQTGSYKRTATGPNGHKVGTNDVDAAGNPKKDAVWYDVQTGKRL